MYVSLLKISARSGKIMSSICDRTPLELLRITVLTRGKGVINFLTQSVRTKIFNFQPETSIKNASQNLIFDFFR